MVIRSKYGVVLERLQKKDIELVRQWRNDPEIVQHMEYQKYISSEDQKNWYDSLSKENDYYFLAKYEKKQIGLVNFKNWNKEKNNAEAGIFIGDKLFLNGLVPYAISFSLFDFGFETLMLKEVTAHILKTNHRAIRYNMSMGFQLQPGQENINNQLYMLDKERYYDQTEKYRKIVVQAMKPKERIIDERTN
jgi:UDP-4-amino-4,6-dideoxy-N-acetyl-beta-L-altrosamine N-acetyltransferase